MSKLFVTQHYGTEKIPVAGAAYLSGTRILATHSQGYHKKMSKFFCLQEKNREGAFLVFRKVSIIENA